MLPWTEAERLEADIRSTIVRLRPDVVITFGEDGLYGHPDHIAIHERTTAAVAALGEDGPALYYVTMPSGCMREVVRHVAVTLVEQGIRGEAPHKILGIADADAFGALAAPPTLVVEVGRFAARKLAAIKCHRTQLEDDALALVAARDAAHLLGTEQFHRADVGSRGDAFIEQFASNLRSRLSQIESTVAPSSSEGGPRSIAMHETMLELLRCPFCGTRVSLVENDALVRAGDRIESGVLGCECCAFPVVAGIPVMIADDRTRDAMHLLEAGQGEAALFTLLGLDETRGEAFRELLTRRRAEAAKPRRRAHKRPTRRRLRFCVRRRRHVFRLSVLGSHLRDGRGAPAGDRPAAADAGRAAVSISAAAPGT